MDLIGKSHSSRCHRLHVPATGRRDSCGNFPRSAGVSGTITHREKLNPLFPLGINPEPIGTAHALLQQTVVREKGVTPALATDSDADRIGAVAKMAAL